MEPIVHTASRPRVVILGGGFGGLACAVALRRTAVEVLMIDRRNVHTFQPLLYQVATAGLSPANIVAPLRAVLRKQAHARVMLAEVDHIDLATRTVQTDRGAVGYDHLVVAVGARTGYFGKDQWAEHAPGLKEVEDALEMRQRLLSAFERAEWCEDPAEREWLLRVVVIGGGPTGVELAGAVAELAHHTVRQEYRNIDTGRLQVHLLEGAPRLLLPFAEDLAQRTREDLEEIGVTVHTGAMVQDIGPGVVRFTEGGVERELHAATLLWGAGVVGGALVDDLTRQLAVAPARGHRVPVDDHCRLAGHPEVFAIGDCAACTDAAGVAVPGLAPAAMQQGRYVARVIRDRLRGRGHGPFRYRDKGMMATIGRNRAVAQGGGMKLTGRIAWFAWLFIHLMYLVGYHNRILVLIQWAWSYITRGRSARILLHKAAIRPREQDVQEPQAEEPSLAASDQATEREMQEADS